MRGGDFPCPSIHESLTEGKGLAKINNILQRMVATTEKRKQSTSKNNGNQDV